MKKRFRLLNGLGSKEKARRDRIPNLLWRQMALSVLILWMQPWEIIRQNDLDVVDTRSFGPSLKKSQRRHLSVSREDYLRPTVTWY